MSIYYVSNAGIDTNDGLTPETAWQTIGKINESIVGGDEVRLRCGDTFYGRVTPPAGIDPEHPTTFTSYGEGKKPTISQYMLPKKGSWEKHDENIYKLDALDTTKYDGNTLSGNSNAGFIKVDGEFKYKKCFLMEELKDNWDFYCDDQYVYVYLDKSPDEASDDIKIACNVRSMGFTAHLKVTNIIFRGSGGHGISGITGGAYIADCEFRELGGSRLGGLERNGKFNRTRYGNGVEAWGNSHDVTVERCKFSDIYDVAITMQGPCTERNWENCIFRENVIWNCVQAFEIWSSGERPDSGFVNCYFENNVCIDSGYCWGYDARPNKGVSTPLLIYGLGCPLCEITVRGNVISRGREGIIFKSGGYANIPETYKIYDNIILLEEGRPLVQGGNLEDPEYVAFEKKLRENNSVYGIDTYAYKSSL